MLTINPISGTNTNVGKHCNILYVREGFLIVTTHRYPSHHVEPSLTQ